MAEIDLQARAKLQHAKRIVVKIGTHVLVNAKGRPDRRRIARIADDISALMAQGKEVILVSSGAIAAGLQTLNITQRPRYLPTLQMAAAVGQTRLLTLYNDCFTRHNICLSQVLLTHMDLKNRTRHLNARNTLLHLLKHHVLPVINENDVVSVDEIKFGDNDVLSALVATLVNADCLILLTTPNGLQQPSTQGPRRVKQLHGLHNEVWQWLGPSTHRFSTGGMASKLQAAQIALKNHIDVLIAPGNRTGVCQKLLAGMDIGTHITPMHTDKRHGARKRWIGFFHKPQGQLTIDAGAAAAITASGKSLLPIGITHIVGQFSKGALVEILDTKGHCLAQGLSGYTSRDIEKIKGCASRDIAHVLGAKDYDEVIHRDNLWLFTDDE